MTSAMDPGATTVGNQVSTDNTGETADVYVYIVLSVLGIIGNAFVCLVMLRYPKVFNSSTNKLILHQSFIDFLATFVFILNRFLRITSTIPANAIGSLYCKLWWSEWPLWSLYVTSTYNLVAISMERYFATCHSIAHRNMLTSRRLKLIMATAWLCGWIPEFHLVPISFQIGDSCEGFWPSRVIQAVGGVSIAVWEFVIPLSIMIFSYTRIIMELHRRSKHRVGDNTNHNDSQNMLSKANKNVTKTLFVVAIFFAICWAPTDVNYILYHSGLNENSLDSVFYQVAGAIVVINMCINPIIYCFTYERFRKQAWKTVSDVCKRPQNRVDIVE